MIEHNLHKIVLADGSVPEHISETSISWLFFSNEYAYKIKRPVKTSFLDFSTLTKRKLFCEKELILNKRYSPEIYLNVYPVKADKNGKYIIGAEEGEIVEYALEMKKLPEGRELNELMIHHKVSADDLQKIALTIAEFHFSSTPLIIKNQKERIANKIKDLLEYTNLFSEIDIEWEYFINTSTLFINQLIERLSPLLESRVNEGFIKDCHGDLHTGNIFILDKPLLFDCIEFSDELRQIDLMEEIAFLCMDIESFGENHFSEKFLDYYNSYNYTVRTPKEYILFLLYKYYKAGVRAKVLAIQWSEQSNESLKASMIEKMKIYVDLMKEYFNQLQNDISTSYSPAPPARRN